MAGLENLLAKYEDAAEGCDGQEAVKKAKEETASQSSGANTMEMEMDQTEIERRFLEYEQLREDKEWKEDERYIPSEHPEEETGDWAEVLKKETEEIQRQRIEENEEMEREVNHEMRKYLGMEFSGSGKIQAAKKTPQPSSSGHLAVVRKMSKQQQKHRTTDQPPSPGGSSITSQDEGDTHKMLEIIHSRDAVCPEDEALKNSNWDDTSTESDSNEKEALADPAPSHLSYDEAQKWEKIEREKLRNKKKIASRLAVLERQKQDFKQELQSKASTVKKPTASFKVDEYILKKREKSELFKQRELAKQQQDEAARVKRLEENKGRFKRAKSNNKAREEARIEHSKKLQAEKARNEVKTELRNMRRHTEPNPPSTPPPARNGAKKTSFS